MKKYGKLVRDKIPDIIKKNNENPIYRILDDFEFKKELYEKLKEENLEVINSNNESDRLEELGDLLEVMVSIAKLDGYGLEDIINMSDKKREKRGSFNKRYYLEDVK